ncbi:hypothetical protein EJ06DRAFT_529256 [Trichodelitschia bisporula]|uniref:F1F0 ATP synthase assembly protein Atp10 n=1 Tax=Trichodelitschia bisporula TaxID=703511 RepID=A0A6G1HZ34_9PEZI|nr:hypothetical protein EJ06DRAFT_529256 [Trichodelitschia bisporula]
MRKSHLTLLRTLAYSAPTRQCRSCAFSTLPRRQNTPPTTKLTTPPPPPRDPEPPLPPTKDRDEEDTTPHPLGRPIGLSHPPNPAASPRRTWREAHASLTNYDKHLARREELKATLSVPYFRDFTRMNRERGKTWLANERLWKAEAARWFPNLRGRTLGSGGVVRDVVPLLKGRVSLVCVFSRSWAEAQVRSFVGEEENPEVRRAIKGSGGRAQIVEVNVEEGALFAAILKLFERRLRGMRDEKDWEKYFLLRSLPKEVREEIGVVNGKVGYVYLVDENCKIRWAGSGDANETEKQALVRGLNRLIEGKTATPRPTDAPGQKQTSAST